MVGDACCERELVGVEKLGCFWKEMHGRCHVVFRGFQFRGEKSEFYLNSCASLASSDRICLVSGRREIPDHEKDHHKKPHNVPFVALGTALLWFGWFGFNPGTRMETRFVWGRGQRCHVGQFGQGHWISSHHSFKPEMALLCCESATSCGI